MRKLCEPGSGFDLSCQICYAFDSMDWRIAALRLVGVGFYVAGAIILGVVGGRWVDGKLNSEPFWTIAGLILGIIVAFYGVYNMLRPFMDGKNNKSDEGGS